jgi:hypothetical protein
MSLIEKFENEARQDVKTFNSIFKSTPIDAEGSLSVEICELVGSDERRIKVGNDTVNMCLIQRKRPKTPITKNYRIVAFSKKTCSKCKKTLPFEAFSPHKTSKGGVRSACKKCCVKEVNAWKQKVKQRLLEKTI